MNQIQWVGIDPFNNGGTGAPCIVTGSWNGWAEPVFRLEDLGILAEYLFDVFGIELTVLEGWVTTDSDDGEGDVPWENVTIDGVEYSTVGAGSWIWETFTPCAGYHVACGEPASYWWHRSTGHGGDGFPVDLCETCSVEADRFDPAGSTERTGVC